MYLMGGIGSQGSAQRRSQLQKTILEILESSEISKTYGESVTHLSWKVLQNYAPEKTIEYTKLLVKHKLIPNSFSASFSRSLRNLRKKGLITLKFGYGDKQLKQPRVTRVFLI